MPKFRVYTETFDSDSIEVEAESEEEARGIVEDDLEWGWEITSVEAIEDEEG